MNAIWGRGQSRFTKFIVVVDEQVDVHDPSEVAWRVFNNVSPERDCLIVPGPLDALDHSSTHPRFGAKMGSGRLAARHSRVRHRRPAIALGDRTPRTTSGMVIDLVPRRW
jgi:3-polyprenyl-4-hydroxybenzoate decarboxylase